MNTKKVNGLHFNQDYQIYVVYNTYDLYHQNEAVRAILADNWGMKLRGYRKYFSYGVLPIDSYDYLCHHIIIKSKKTNQVIMGFKSLTKSVCDKTDFEFPIKKHLINEQLDKYMHHSKAIDQWIESRSGQELAYSTGFTVEPTLSKAEKKHLTDILFDLFYHFYTTYKIPNILQAISIRFKLDERQDRIGFRKLDYQGHILDEIETKKYDNVQSYIMVLEDYGFKNEHILQAKSIQALWDNRIEFIGEDLNEIHERVA